MGRSACTIATWLCAFRRCSFFLLLVMSSMLTACQWNMAQPPYVMIGETGQSVYASLDPELQTPTIPILYVTDRAVDETLPNGPSYGYLRSRNVQYGVVNVGLSPEPTWDELVKESTTIDGCDKFTLHIDSVEPLGEMHEILKWAEVKDGRFDLKPEAKDELKKERDAFVQVIKRWLDRTDVKDAYVYVHGFNNKFSDAAFRLAECWHFAGRTGVPIMFTWPAGRGGLTGYAYDRESGEYAVLHLKMLLLTLAECPEIERVHLIGHSRGTDVASSALRELHLEIRAVTGRGGLALYGDQSLLNLTEEEVKNAPTTAEYLKIKTLVLAAPDLDADVFSQRFVTENLFRAADRVVVYFSNRDSALALAQFLFNGARGRLGDLDIDDFTPQQIEFLTSMPSVEMIDCDTSGFSSHAYVFQHPSALSDLILSIRQSRAPGAENGRPLKQPKPGIWVIDDDYLKPEKAK